MRQSHHVRRPALRRNRRAPRARSRLLRLGGTQGTDPDRPEEVERARGADMARKWRLSKTPHELMTAALPSPCRATKRPPTARPAPAPHRARALAKTPALRARKKRA